MVIPIGLFLLLARGSSSYERHAAWFMGGGNSYEISYEYRVKKIFALSVYGKKLYAKHEYFFWFKVQGEGNFLSNSFIYKGL